MRAVLTRGSMDLSQRDGGLPPDSVVQDAETILVDSARLIDTLHDPAPHAMLQIALAPCSPFSVTTALMRQTATLAEQRGVLLHTHLAETQDEAAFCQQRFGCSPLDYLEDCGWLRPGTWLAHGIHFSAPDIARLGRARVGVTHCPCSNQLLASGTCPVCALEAAGVPVGLGVDGSASNDGSNLLQEVRAAMLLQPRRERDRRRQPSGRIGAGRRAAPPIASAVRSWAASRSVRRRTWRCTRSMNCASPAPVTPWPPWCCAAPPRADRVMVAGRWVVEDGQIPGLDIPALMRRHGLAASRLAHP